MHSSICRTFIIKHQSWLYSNNHRILFIQKLQAQGWYGFVCFFPSLYIWKLYWRCQRCRCYCIPRVFRTRMEPALLTAACFRWLNDWAEKVWIFARMETINWYRDTRWATDFIRNSFEWKNRWYIEVSMKYFQRLESTSILYNQIKSDVWKFYKCLFCACAFLTFWILSISFK